MIYYSRKWHRLTRKKEIRVLLSGVEPKSSKPKKGSASRVLLGVLSSISDDHPCHFYMGVPGNLACMQLPPVSFASHGKKKLFFLHEVEMGHVFVQAHISQRLEISD